MQKRSFVPDIQSVVVALATVIVLAGAARPASGQTDWERANTDLDSELLRDHTAPQQALRLSRGMWTTVAVLGAGASLAKRLEDERATARLLEGAGPLEFVIDVADWYGDGITLGTATVGLYLWGALTGAPEPKSFSRDLTESLLLSGGIVWALKTSVDARRPDGGRYSFPSGHTASAFAAAPIFHKYYGTEAGIAAYTLACFTGMGRMEDRRHYLTDVLVGAAIGVTCGRQVSRGNGIVSFMENVRISSSGVALSIDF